MISRPVAIPLFLLIAGILLLDWFAPAFVVGEHYSLHLGQAESFRYEIREENSPKKNWLCYTAKVTHYFDGQKWQKTKGKVLFCIPRSDKRHLEYASLVESSATPRLIEKYPQSNFDYKKFMQRKRVFHTIYARNYSLSSEPKNKDLQYYAHKFNTLLKQRINRSELTSGNKALASSLLLGDKTSLDKQVRLSFSAAGIAHILCVSGLHIGLIVAMFDIFLKYLHLLGIKGFYLRRIILIILVWIIAFVVGCTPSSLRVALMLSLAMLTNLTAYRSDTINVLFVSAFIMLLCSPMLLFDVSFQLSYLAVFGIVACKPLSDKWIDRYVNRHLTSVAKTASTTMSAQLFTLPIVVCRFGTFPLLFLISNLLVLPFVGIILFTTICLVCFVDVPYISTMTACILDFELTLLQQAAQLTDLQ